MYDFFYLFGVAVFPIVCGLGLACLLHAIQRKIDMKKDWKKATNDFDKKKPNQIHSPIGVPGLHILKARERQNNY